MIALRLFLTLTISVSTAEITFSKQKLIKSYLKSKLSLDRCSNFSLVSIKHEIVEKRDFKQVICNFSSAKSLRLIYDNVCSATFLILLFFEY